MNPFHEDEAPRYLKASAYESKVTLLQYFKQKGKQKTVILRHDSRSTTEKKGHPLHQNLS